MFIGTKLVDLLSPFSLSYNVIWMRLHSKSIFSVISFIMFLVFPLRKSIDPSKWVVLVIVSLAFNAVTSGPASMYFVYV